MNKIDIVLYLCLISIIFLITFIGSLVINLIAIVIIFMTLIKNERVEKERNKL